MTHKEDLSISYLSLKTRADELTSAQLDFLMLQQGRVTSFCSVPLLCIT